MTWEELFKKMEEVSSNVHPAYGRYRPAARYSKPILKEDLQINDFYRNDQDVPLSGVANAESALLTSQGRLKEASPKSSKKLINLIQEALKNTYETPESLKEDFTKRSDSEDMQRQYILATRRTV